MLSFFTLVDGSSGRLHLGSTAAVRGDSSTIDQHKSKHAALQALFREDLDVVMRREPQICLLYTSPSPRDLSTSRMPSSA